MNWSPKPPKEILGPLPPGPGDRGPNPRDNRNPGFYEPPKKEGPPNFKPQNGGKPKGLGAQTTPKSTHPTPGGGPPPPMPNFPPKRQVSSGRGKKSIEKENPPKKKKNPQKRTKMARVKRGKPRMVFTE